jgi:hypothetical protein
MIICKPGETQVLCKADGISSSIFLMEFFLRSISGPDENDNREQEQDWRLLLSL